MGCPTQLLPHDQQLHTDSYVTGWRTHMGDLTVSGVWPPQTAQLHISNLELKAVVLDCSINVHRQCIYTSGSYPAIFCNREAFLRDQPLASQAQLFIK